MMQQWSRSQHQLGLKRTGKFKAHVLFLAFVLLPLLFAFGLRARTLQGCNSMGMSDMKHDEIASLKVQ